MTEAKPQPFTLVNEWIPAVSSSQVQMLVQLQCRTQARRQTLATLELELARTVRRRCTIETDARVGRSTILIADNESVCRAVAREILGKLGSHVLSSEADPRSWPAHEPIDLMLLDVPFWSVAQSQRVRKAKRRATHVIVATPLPEGAALDALRAAGADAFVRKPYDPRELERCVAQALGFTGR